MKELRNNVGSSKPDNHPILFIWPERSCGNNNKKIYYVPAQPKKYKTIIYPMPAAL